MFEKIKNFLEDNDKTIQGTVFSNRLGLPGSGKTLGMVEEDLLPHLLDGQEVYTNIFINWNKPNIHFFTADEFEELAPTLRNCVLVMDEIGQVMEPRAWEQESGNIRRFFQLHRHRHVDIYGTTQDISLVAKSAWIVVDEWILCEKYENTLIRKLWDKIRKQKTFSVQYQDMTYQELKKASNGWDIGGTDEFGTIGGDIRIKKYKVNELVHSELNEYKKELYHYYCKKCAGRQGKIITTRDKKDINKEIYCEKHKDEILEIRETGLYDSEYEIEIKEKEIYFQAFIPSPKGYRLIKYGGPLTNGQMEYKKNLNNQNKIK